MATGGDRNAYLSTIRRVDGRHACWRIENRDSCGNIHPAGHGVDAGDGPLASVHRRDTGLHQHMDNVRWPLG